MATHDTKLGIGYELGMFFHAPAGTSLPAYPTETLAAAWEEVGVVSADGISLAMDKSTENLRSWANKIVRTILTEHAETVGVPIMDTTKEVFNTLLGAGSASETAASAAHGKLVSASLTQAALPPEEAFLFIMKDDDDAIAIGCEYGQITAIDNVTFAPNAAITWTPTITGLQDGWQIITDDGQTTS